MEERLREGTNPCTVIYSSGYIILKSSIMISDAEFNTPPQIEDWREEGEGSKYENKMKWKWYEGKYKARDEEKMYK